MIPVSEPLLDDRDLELVMECVRTGWISSSGNFIKDFEDGWAAYCGRRYGIAVSNGTAALQVALACLDLQPGDEVIMPTFTIISCATGHFHYLTKFMHNCEAPRYELFNSAVTNKCISTVKIQIAHISCC